MRTPSSTYRIQFNSGFTFKDAINILDYLSTLGITDIYASPIFRAREGSIHGYDVVDPTCINPELGTEEDFAQLIRAVQEKGMGWLQDIVPNHMAYDGQNPMLMDIFESGTLSDYYNFFDVEWDHAYDSMKGRLLAPFLGKPYGESLESGEIRIKFGQNGFMVNYYSLQYPLRIESYESILSPNLGRLRETLGPDHPDYIRFVGIIFTLKGYPCQPLSQERVDQTRFIKGMLWEIYNNSETVREFVDRNLSILNGEAGPSELSNIDQLLYDQFFRLSFWKVASEEINYRRFFSINELISLRIEDPEVFQRCHEKIFQLTSAGAFTGLRVDHIDGLYNPLEYLKRLREGTSGIYTTVEKILAFQEDLPTNWPVQGTSGYDYLNYLNGIFCQAENEDEFSIIYQSFTGAGADRENLLHEKKALIIEHFMTGDVDNLAHLMKKISSKDRGGGDITLHGLRRAIFEVLALFPVYRTYISPESFTGMDRRYITDAVERAKKRVPALVNEINYLAKFLLLKYEDYLGEEEKALRLKFAMRFQQFSGPLMAKGFEDTLLYVYNRLISLNEVGGDPFRFGISLSEFHDYNKARSENWPNAMNASSTHDTKRGEDVRARINVLSEIPDEWGKRVNAWSRLNEANKTTLHGLKVPARNDEYLLYQTLVGAYPYDESEHSDFVRRICEYVIKATREARVYTGWIKPDSEYEEAFESFVNNILDKSARNVFLEDFLAFQKKVAHFGLVNSLSQVVLKICSPGIPDFYQGADLWEFSLVDPDNRRQVDFRRRISFQESIFRDMETPGFPKQLMDSAEDGRIKLFVIQQCLLARREHRNLYRNGSYIPLAVNGQHSGHTMAFARREESSWAIAVAPRFCTSLTSEKEFPLGLKVWGDTAIMLPEDAPANWKNVITGEEHSFRGELPVGAILSTIPVAQLLPA
ncbi:MAG: malto-oligosyltrehalose synthase [Syntrophobacteraceae bacterium]